MSYQWLITGESEALRAHGYRESGRHCYLNLDRERDGVSATVRIGLENVRLAVYPHPGTSERAYYHCDFAAAGAVTTWVPNTRELGDGHWLHTFAIDTLLAWARQESARTLTAIGDGLVHTDRMIEDSIERPFGRAVEPRLHSSAEVAAELGVTQRRVQQLAKSRGVGRVIGNSMVFLLSDIDAMRARVPGRPPLAR